MKTKFDLKSTAAKEKHRAKILRPSVKGILAYRLQSKTKKKRTAAAAYGILYAMILISFDWRLELFVSQTASWLAYARQNLQIWQKGK